MFMFFYLSLLRLCNNTQEKGNMEAIKQLIGV